MSRTMIANPETPPAMPRSRAEAPPAELAAVVAMAETDAYRELMMAPP
jgi:hypothetical protein